MQCFSCGFRLCVCAFVLLSLSLHCNVPGPVGVKRDLFKRGRKKLYGVAPNSLHDQTRSADTSFCTEDVSEDVPDFPVTLDSDGHGVDEGVVLFLFRSQTGHALSNTPSSTSVSLCSTPSDNRSSLGITAREVALLAQQNPFFLAPRSSPTCSAQTHQINARTFSSCLFKVSWWSLHVQ